jgi:hypothetical protein
MVSFGTIWNVFHLTTHEKRKTDQNYKKTTYKTLHNTTFFPGMTSVMQKISPDQSNGNVRIICLNLADDFL